MGSLSAVANWFGGAKPTGVSCAQNRGPFANVGEPDLSRDDVRNKLLEFYRECLAPDYKKGYLPKDANGNSESQAYALWQAYLAGDKKTFRTVHDWTNANIRRNRDSLFSWKFEVQKRFFLLFWQKPLFANYRVNILDENSATDADTDIAYVLLRAGSDWKNQSYIDEGKAIVSDIWGQETAEAGGKRYVVAGNWANTQDELIINPSYFSPQAYRTFALYDGAHDWNKVIIDGYDLLTKVSHHGAGQPFVPPNWVVVAKSDHTIKPYANKSDGQDFSYDAFRAFWRVAQDQALAPSFLSWNYISSVTSFGQTWQANQEVCALFKFGSNGYACDKSTTSTLAAPLAVFSVTNGFTAAQLVQKYYIRDGKLQFPDTDFYAKSWHWFGVWLWSHS